MKILSEIKPPLTCRVVLLLNRKIVLAWESKISLVPNCLVNCLLIVCVMNLVMDRKINFVFNSANILGLHIMKTLCQPSFFTQTSDDCFIIDSVTVGLNIFYSIL